MNLNYAYNRQALITLANSADKSFATHNLVIDFDGEVIVDPEIHFEAVPLNRYKFCAVIEDKYLRDDVSLSTFYDALENVFTTINREYNTDIKGNIPLMGIAA